MKRELLAVGVLLMSLPAGAAGIYRCTSASGAVTYQEIACEGGATGGVSNIPTSFPEVNTAERDRVLQQAAALEARNLRRYEIDSNERVAMADIAARERSSQAASAAQSADAYPVYAFAGRGAHFVSVVGRVIRHNRIATGVR